MEVWIAAAAIIVPVLIAVLGYLGRTLFASFLANLGEKLLVKVMETVNASFAQVESKIKELQDDVTNIRADASYLRSNGLEIRRAINQGAEERENLRQDLNTFREENHKAHDRVEKRLGILEKIT